MQDQRESGDLTDRERQVLDLSMKGLTDRAIGTELGLGLPTVHTYWNRIKQKLGGATRAEIVAQAMRISQVKEISETAEENERLIEEVMRRASAEEELMRNHRVLQAVVDAAPDLIYIKNESGEFELVNSAFAQLVNRDKQEIVGLTDSEVFEPGLALAHQGSDQVVFHSGKALELESELDQQLYHTVKFPIFSSEGKVEFVGGITRNITSRLKMESELKLTEERLRIGYDAANLSNWEFTFATGSVIWTQNTASMHGLNPDEFAGTYEAFLALVHPEDQDLVRSKVSHAIETGSGYEVEFRSFRPDGRLVWVFGQAKVIPDVFGKPERMIGVAMDITARKLQEQRSKEAEERLRLALPC